MVPRFVVRALLRLALALALIAIMAPLASHEAEAGRRFSRHGRAVGVVTTSRAAAASARKSASHAHSAEESGAGSEDANKTDGDTFSPSGELVRASVAKVLKAAPAAHVVDEVPGCAPGNFCTVCVAGCSGEVNAIVNSVPKAQRIE
jgi:hypothetical protein